MRYVMLHNVLSAAALGLNKELLAKHVEPIISALNPAISQSKIIPTILTILELSKKTVLDTLNGNV